MILTILTFFLSFIYISVWIIILILVIQTLKKYLTSKKIHKEKKVTPTSLHEVLKKHRMEAKLTQEFVAEAIGVSRQAVSKWESGSCDPSTSNLIALSKLYKISPSDLFDEII